MSATASASMSSMASSSAISPPSALEQALAKIIAGKQREWEREKAVLVAESRAVIAELREQVVTLQGRIKEFADGQLARIDARLAEVKDGKSVDRAEVESMVRTAVDAMPKPKDGESVSVEDIERIVSGCVARAQVDLEDVTRRAIAALPPPKDGTSVDPEAVKVMVGEQVAAAMATLRVPKDGDPGKDADPAVVKAMIDEAVAALPAPKDGQSVTVADVGPLIVEEVQKAIAALPQPKNGEDGKSVEIEEIGALVNEAVALSVGALPPARAGKDADPEAVRAIVQEEVGKAVGALPRPQDGRSVTPEEARPIIAEEVAKAVAVLPAPPPAKDGVGLAGALIDRAGHLIITLTDGTTRDLGQVVGKDADQGELLAFLRDAVAALPKPKDGTDGLGFDDLTVEHDGVRTFTLRFARGTESKEFAFRVPVMVYRGVFRDGEAYERGDTVTWGGSLWHANEDTGEKPGDGSKAWQLAAKRGRDGKEIVTTRPATPVKAG